LPHAVAGEAAAGAAATAHTSGRTTFGYHAADGAAQVSAERFLALSGGRDAWKSVRSLRILAVNHVPSVPLPYLFEVSLDFQTPRSMTRLLNHDMNRLRGFLGSSGWGVKESPSGPQTYAFDADRLAQERVLWAGAFSRNLWRLASGDPALTIRTADDGRLEFTEKDGALTSWFRFDDAGYPVRFGFPGDDKGLELGPYASYGDRRIPLSGSTPEGVRFESIYLRASDKPLNVPETAPADMAAYNPK
jgi:hypothetical protein